MHRNNKGGGKEIVFWCGVRDGVVFADGGAEDVSAKQKPVYELGRLFGYTTDVGIAWVLISMLVGKM